MDFALIVPSVIMKLLSVVDTHVALNLDPCLGWKEGYTYLGVRTVPSLSCICIYIHIYIYIYIYIILGDLFTCERNSKFANFLSGYKVHRKKLKHFKMLIKVNVINRE
jgi:hypothetical protein